MAGEVDARWIDAGADIIVMHGAPVLHGIEMQKPIFYDLGNFIYNVPPWLTYIHEPMAFESAVVATLQFSGKSLSRQRCVRLPSTSSDRPTRGARRAREQSVHPDARTPGTGHRCSRGAISSSASPTRRSLSAHASRSSGDTGTVAVGRWISD